MKEYRAIPQREITRRTWVQCAECGRSAPLHRTYTLATKPFRYYCEACVGTDPEPSAVVAEPGKDGTA